jgi:hypothetical protein
MYEAKFENIQLWYMVYYELQIKIVKFIFILVFIKNSLKNCIIKFFIYFRIDFYKKRKRNFE